MTGQKAQDVLISQFNNKKIKITLNGETLQELPKKNFVNKDVINDILTNQLDTQSAAAWPLGLFKHQDIDIKSIFNHDEIQKAEEPLKNWINGYNQNKEDAKNANIAYENDTFVIKPEYEGTKIQTDKASVKILDAIENNKEEVNLDDCFVQPTLTKDDPKLQESLTNLQNISNIKAQYKFNNQTVTIPNSEIIQWLEVDDKGNITVNQDEVKDFVKKMSDKYNTQGKNYTFNSTKQGEVQVPCNVYSWSIDNKKEPTALANAILKGEDFTRIPITKGSASANGPFIGKTYIEVDKTNQHMWLYKDGKVVIETDVVTGKPGQDTPTGVFYVWKKEKNAILRGPGYASPVSYWMPIDWEGVGIHDSNWQTAYGGTRWRDGFGSHGCINTPPAIMAQLFNATPEGTPVIVIN